MIAWVRLLRLLGVDRSRWRLGWVWSTIAA
jgi:hypothetical protein